LFERRVNDNIVYKITAFPYANARMKMPLEIYFIYSDNNEIYCILRHVA